MFKMLQPEHHLRIEEIIHHSVADDRPFFNIINCTSLQFHSFHLSRLRFHRAKFLIIFQLLSCLILQLNKPVMAASISYAKPKSGILTIINKVKNSADLEMLPTITVMSEYDSSNNFGR